MTDIHKKNLNLLNESGLQSIRLGDKLPLASDERIHGLAGAALHNVVGVVAAPLGQKHVVRLPTGQRVAGVLERNRTSIHRSFRISVRVEGGLLTFTHNGRYLILQGMEEAIEDWSASSISVHIDRISGHHFNVLGEDGGFCIAVPDHDEPSICALVKRGAAWPSVDPVFEAIRKDEALTVELRELQEAYTPMTQAFLVALAARHANHIPQREMAQNYFRGTLLAYQQKALAWVRELTGAQIDEVERFTEARLLQLHDALDELDELNAESEEFRSSLAVVAAEREEIDALFSLFHLAGVRMKVVAQLAETLDAKAEDYIYAVPRLESLRDNLVLTRSANLDGDTWWAKLVP